MTAQKYPLVIHMPEGIPMTLSAECGKSIIIVGANGSGKTRLGVYIESQVPPSAVHRIAAQKSLNMVDNFPIISFERASSLLRYGFESQDVPRTSMHTYKAGNRWRNKPATHLLTDFDALLQTLFADQNAIATRHLQQRKENPDIPVPITQIERLREIWEDLLPHRTLKVSDAAIRIDAPAHIAEPYPASEMSDGERALFYFLGQCLLAPDKGVIIIDEPESHIHKAILEPLWSAIEKARPDCSFIYITHDLEFATAHPASIKYYIRTYTHASPPRWLIEEIPEDTGLPESVVIELVGSRKPILFVEGTRGSLDLTIYRSLYADFTIMPIGSCDAVIRSVASYKGSNALHWLGVHGLVDADDRSLDDITNLKEQNVYVLPVAEVENLLLLPNVFLELGKSLLCIDPDEILVALRNEVMKQARANLDLVSARYATRQLDRRLKRIQIDAKDLTSLQAGYHSQLTTVDPSEVFSNFKARFEQSINTTDLPQVLALYDNKGLLAFAANILGLKNQKYLLEKVGRLLGNNEGQKLREELAKVLPQIAL